MGPGPMGLDLILYNKNMHMSHFAYTCKKWNFWLNFHTMRKLSELYSEIFQTQSSGCVSGLDHFRNFTNLKILNI